MPTAFSRLFGGTSPHVEGAETVKVLRSLLLLLRQPTVKRRHVMVTRLLRREPFRLAMVAEVRDLEKENLDVTVVTGSAVGLDLAAVQDTLGSHISPLLGVGDKAPRWLDLHGDPFGPGSAFLRKFNLASALVLPLTAAESTRVGAAYLILATKEPLSFRAPLVQEIILAWSLFRLASVGGMDSAHDRDPVGEATPGQESEVWQRIPTALAIVANDSIVRTNEAAEVLLKTSVGRDGRSWALWLAAAVRRLESANRDHEVLLASQQQNRSLEVSLGPALPHGRGRVVAIRDATDEVLADSRHSESISTLSHELRTPLTSMKNSVSLVLRGDAGQLTPQQERFLALSMRNIDRLDRLITDLLDVSRAEAGRLSLHRQMVDLGSLLRDALEMLSATARQRSVTLDYSGLPTSFPAHVDSDKIVQMIHNTVGNALKYTEEGGYVRIWLQSRAEQLPPLAVYLAERYFLPLKVFTLVVEDNGMGMSDEVIQNLFHPFSRGREAEDSHKPGSGLGLHITRALVEAHGGTIDLQSGLDVGTTVNIVLPRDPESEQVVVAARRLGTALINLGREARLICLDARRPDLELTAADVQRADQAVKEFLVRLIGDETPADNSPPGGVGSLLPGEDPGLVTADRLCRVADGLWAAVSREWERFAPAWEVEKAKPNCPGVLAHAVWESRDLSLEPDVAKTEATQSEYIPEDNLSEALETEGI
ncbi:MAG: HAMP domain-containing sensor histidine kinase [bacterium]